MTKVAVSVTDLILPYFVTEGVGKREEIKSMPGIYRHSIDDLMKEIGEIRKLGIKSILLFGVPKAKDENGSEAFNDRGIVQRAVRSVKKKFKDIEVITDVCLCAYATHGHCGVIKKSNVKSKKSGSRVIIDAEETRKVLAKIALSHAEAGADLVAPSAMREGQVKAIRSALDKNGFKGVKILAYSAKYASNFYGPFREAMRSAPAFGDRRGYQLDYRDPDEALTRIKQDIDQGADIVMVKPALAYLDVIWRAKKKFNVPVAAYNVSGEYALLKGNGASQEIVTETIIAIKRAGADVIITYFAKEIAKWLKSR